MHFYFDPGHFSSSHAFGSPKMEQLVILSVLLTVLLAYTAEGSNCSKSIPVICALCVVLIDIGRESELLHIGLG